MDSLLFLLIAAQMSATAAWSPPTYGTPVVHYVVEHSIDDGPWMFVDTTTDTTLTLVITFEDCHRVRVAGVDAQDRQGPFSFPSATYCPVAVAGEPDAAGKPRLEDRRG